MATSVEVSLRQYRWSHLGQPRGRGGWMFMFPSTANGGPAHHETFSGTYTEARKAAVARARVLGALIIEVLP